MFDLLFLALLFLLLVGTFPAGSQRRGWSDYPSSVFGLAVVVLLSVLFFR